jgi:hypothetical protein
VSLILCFLAEHHTPVSSVNHKESGYNFNSAQEATIWQSREPVRPDQQQGPQKHSGGKPTKQFLPGPAEWCNSEQNAAISKTEEGSWSCPDV